MANTIDESLRNCAHCKKPTKPRRRYYRNNRYYCSFNCWRAAKKAADPASSSTG